MRRHDLGRGAIGLCAAVLLMISLGACSPRLIDPGPMTGQPELTSNRFVTRDGLALPVRTWPAEGKTKAIVLAVHGFNDYSMFIDACAGYLAEQGIQTYAYDQRGFGAAPFSGRWFATDRYLTDAEDMAAALHARHPDLPLYLLGESMGGAVTMTTLATRRPGTVAGAILSAPAVWGRATMPFYQRGVLWLAARTIPSVVLTGRGLQIKASDNIEMLRAMYEDPLVIKGAQVSAINGLVDLMDAALQAAGGLDQPVLILYGAKDEIIKPGPTRTMMGRLPVTGAEHRRVAVYPDGYHMLMRDLQAKTVWRDIAHWITDPKTPLPSGAEQTAADYFSAGKDR